MFDREDGASEAGWEQQDQADRELQEMTREALDRCLQAGAKPDDLKLLAWQAGLPNWKPNAHSRTTGLG